MAFRLRWGSVDAFRSVPREDREPLANIHPAICRVQMAFRRLSLVILGSRSQELISPLASILGDHRLYVNCYLSNCSKWAHLAGEIGTHMSARFPKPDRKQVT